MADKRQRFQNEWNALKSKYALDKREWISWKLRKRVVMTYVGLNIAAIGVIAALWILSKKRHGFVKTTDGSKIFLEISWGIGLLWTTLPSLLFQLHSLGYGVIVAACLFRQPFVELRRGAIAKRSIFLDYLSFLPWERIQHACSNKHWTLLFSALMSYIFTVLVVPLSSRLFAENPHVSTEMVTLVQNTSFEFSYQPLTNLN